MGDEYTINDVFIQLFMIPLNIYCDKLRFKIEFFGDDIVWVSVHECSSVDRDAVDQPFQYYLF